MIRLKAKDGRTATVDDGNSGELQYIGEIADDGEPGYAASVAGADGSEIDRGRFWNLDSALVWLYGLGFREITAIDGVLVAVDDAR